MKGLLSPLVVALGLGLAPLGAADVPEDGGSSLVLVTLDTTRADAIGAWGSASPRTPNLDALAARGTRFARALTPSPLTLPAHASLLTGLDPHRHGLRSNGGEALCTELPTLATVLSARGWSTAAFVSSRVLDSRFGLARGFDHYDEEMAAERVGEYGYPERDAAMVTDAAIDWLRERPAGCPFLLWLHYYDPHAPYRPPPELRGGSPAADYAGEVAFVDRELGRLIGELGSGAVIAVVGDHGEMLGEHGERSHGIFLYRAALEVPLILAGPGVPKARIVPTVVSIRRLPATLLHLLGIADSGLPGPVLAGFPAGPSDDTPPVYSEATLPASAYGWAPLTALTDGRWRYVAAPRPELYDLQADPDEILNLVEIRPAEAERLGAALEELGSRSPLCRPQQPELDPSTRAALRSLGYVDDSGEGDSDAIDPKDGVAMLAEAERAAVLLSSGDAEAAVAAMESLVERNPANVPFLTQLAEAQLATGDAAAAIATHRRAVASNPASEFLRLNLAHALGQAGRGDEARGEYQKVLEIDPRSAPAWLWLVELAPEERRPELIRQAVAAGTDSLTLLLELAEIEALADRPRIADGLLERAGRLAPDSAAVWLAQAELAERRGGLDVALVRCERAAAAEPANPATALCVGRVHLAAGDKEKARAHLRRAAVLGKGSEAGAEAERLLASLR